jgi:hypothetical protein
VKRGLPVPAPGPDRGAIRRHQRLEFIQHAEPGGRIGAEHRAPLPEEGHQLSRGRIEHAESPRPPVALPVDIGAGIQQELDQIAIPLGNRLQQDRSIKMETRKSIIETSLELGVVCQQLRHLRLVTLISRRIPGPGPDPHPG